MMWYWSGGMHWWGWLLGSVGMIVFWGLIIWGVWYLVTGRAGQFGSSRGETDAKRILDERLARGEIDTDEYRRRLTVIQGSDVRSGDGQSPVGTRSQR